MPLKIIDLFAGPGGLGEGFASLRHGGKQAFKIAVSIEKEASAHRTLQLRALFRQFNRGDVPEAYYAFLRGELGRHPEDVLYRLPELKQAVECAKLEAQQLTLGESAPKLVYKRISEAVGSEECVLIGGPPCQAYSLVGRSRNYGAKDKKYSAVEDHRNFLYLEYLKIISRFQPKVFVMENVKGILSAQVDGKLIFDSIREDLQDPFRAVRVQPEKGRKKHRYIIRSFVCRSPTAIQPDSASELAPRDFIIRAEEYGIPQARHRVILFGIREDIVNETYSFPTLNRAAGRPTVEEVISDLPKLRSRLSKAEDSELNWRRTIQAISSETLHKIKHDPLVVANVYRAFQKQIKALDRSPGLTGADKGLEKKRSINSGLSADLANWYYDETLGNYVTNHESRGHIAGDLQRYLYYSTVAANTGVSPNSRNLPEAFWPAHKNFGSGKFADRFRVQISTAPGTTVTSHISKDGHYFIHYDPSQCRSLTVREAARIQTFPDNYYFVGNRTQQYVQVGNAVPPFLAKQIAECVYNLIA